MGVARGDAVASEEREFAFDACATAASLGGGTIESPAVGKRPPIEAQAPARSVAQRLESLRQANEIRMKRAALKQTSGTGRSDLKKSSSSPRVRREGEGQRALPRGSEARGRLERLAFSEPAPSARRRHSASSPSASAVSCSPPFATETRAGGAPRRATPPTRIGRGETIGQPPPGRSITTAIRWFGDAYLSAADPPL